MKILAASPAGDGTGQRSVNNHYRPLFCRQAFIGHQSNLFQTDRQPALLTFSTKNASTL